MLLAKVLDNNYSVTKEGRDLVFKNQFSQEVLRIDKDGKILRNSNLYLTLDDTSNSDYLQLILKS